MATHESLQAPAPVSEVFTPEDLRAVWRVLAAPDRLAGFEMLAAPLAEDFFLALDSPEQGELIVALPRARWRALLRSMAPDDAADLVQVLTPSDRDEVMALLEERTRHEVNALLAYAEDEAGGLMNPRFARLRPHMTVDEAIAYVRRQARERVETIYSVYVLDPEQRLLGVVSFRELLSSASDKSVAEVMNTEVVVAREDLDQEALGLLFSRSRLLAIPVVDAGRRVKGIVTLDDIVDVVREEATEDIQKIGGSETLDAPYLQVGVMRMIRKRAGWLSALFIGEMLTATAMGYFEAEIARAVILALFVPLIISSGGNSGSQATTLVIRAMALGELKLRDWWRVVRRELVAGLGLGGILGALGALRVLLWQEFFHVYGPHAGLIAATVGGSLVGVVMWGTLTGSTLPFVLQWLGFDSASASAPFVATVVDVSGLIIYFSVASALLTGTLL